MSQNLDILQKQEDLLQFEHFNYDDAYTLGTFMVDYAKKHSVTIAVSIIMNNGCIVFQHCPSGTSLLNQKWIERKFNIVKLTEKSSLYIYQDWEEKGQVIESHGYSSEDYIAAGGAFPIRIKGTDTVLGAIVASNLYHVADHEFVVYCLKEFLNCPEAPDYPYTIPE